MFDMDIGIDLGTANVLVYVKEHVVLVVPKVVLIRVLDVEITA